MKVRIINPPTEITAKSRGPDIGMRAMLDAIEAGGWPEWLEAGVPDLVPTDHVPLVWRWTDKHDVALYYARNNIPWIAGQNIFFDDIGHVVPHIADYELELLHSRSLLGVITDGSDYANLIRFAARHDVMVLQAPYPTSEQLTPQSCDIDFLVYDKVSPTNKSVLASVVHALPGKVEHVVYGSYKHADYIDKLANTKALIYLAEHDRYPVAMIEALSAGCRVIGASRCCGPARDMHSCFTSVKYPYVSEEVAEAAMRWLGMTFACKEANAKDARVWITSFPDRFIEAITQLATHKE